MLVFPGCKFLQLKSYLGFVTCILQNKLHQLCFIIILCCSYTLKKRPTAKSIADSMEMLVMQVINTKTQQNKNQMKQNYKRDIKSTQKHIKSTQNCSLDIRQKHLSFLSNCIAFSTSPIFESFKTTRSMKYSRLESALKREIQRSKMG